MILMAFLISWTKMFAKTSLMASTSLVRRVMSEAEETGPYAVSHQNAILAEWSRIQALLH